MDKKNIVKTIENITIFLLIEVFIMLISSRILMYYKPPSLFSNLVSVFVFFNSVIFVLVIKWFNGIHTSVTRNEQNLKILRTERHDYLNHLQSIFGLAVTGDKKEVIEYLSELGANTRFNTQIMNFNNPALRVLLQTKKDELAAKGIVFKLVIQSTLDNLNMSPCDITTVFGNLLKNAMDVLVSSTGGVQKNLIVFEITESDDHYIFRVKDSGPHIPENIVDNIFSEGFSTKGTDRGFGLSLVKRTVEKYIGSIVYSPFPKGFTVTIPKEQNDETFVRFDLA